MKQIRMENVVFLIVNLRLNVLFMYKIGLFYGGFNL